MYGWRPWPTVCPSWVYHATSLWWLSFAWIGLCALSNSSMLISGLWRTWSLLIHFMLSLFWMSLQKVSVIVCRPFLKMMCSLSTVAYWQKMLLWFYAFTTTTTPIGPQLPPYNTTTRSVAYARYHDALQDILTLVPIAACSLYVAIQRHMPFRQRSTADQVAYTKNILDVMDYVPTLRRQIIPLLVDHLIKIDVSISAP